MTMCKVLNVKQVGKRPAADRVYVGRPSKWGNPFVIGRNGARAQVIAKYRAWIVQQPALMKALEELRGKDLVCWCAPEACHADVLLESRKRMTSRRVSRTSPSATLAFHHHRQRQSSPQPIPVNFRWSWPKNSRWPSMTWIHRPLRLSTPDSLRRSSRPANPRCFAAAAPPSRPSAESPAGADHSWSPTAAPAPHTPTPPR
jgi:hypothetical protein